MADNCKGCGAEIFPGQRFCRMCGRATGDLADEHAPTQNMPPPDQGPYPGWQGPSRQGPAATAPAQRPDTSPVYPAQPQPAYYQRDPGYAAYYPPPAQSGFKWGWLFAFIGIGLFATIVFAVLLFAARVKRHMPPMGEPPNVTSAGAPGEAPMDESNGIVTPTQTQITRQFPLLPGASLSIKNANGRIHVESWDGQGAQVTVTKVGGSEATRRRVPIYQQTSPNRLSLRTADARNMSLDVSYDVKIPKAMGKVEISSVNGSVKLDGVSGDIDVNSTNGSIDLSDIGGSASVKNVNGSIHAVFDQVSSDRSMSFANVSGSISLQFKSELHADLTAHTATGSIHLDPEWGIEVNKGLIGASARGPIGAGGPALRIDNVNGSISITKVPGTTDH